MVSRLRPLDVKLRFRDKRYGLGETVDLTVELRVNGDAEVREARVDLVCEEQWSETYTMMVPDTRTLKASIHVGARGAAPPPPPPPPIPKRVNKRRQETYVHSSAVFLKESSLRAGPVSHRVALKIGDTPLRRSTDGTARWRLVARVDVVRARDVTARQPIEVVA